MTRQYTNKLFEMVDDGIITYETIAECALKYMSEDDVKDMAVCNELLYDEEEEY